MRLAGIQVSDQVRARERFERLERISASTLNIER